MHTQQANIEVQLWTDTYAYTRQASIKVQVWTDTYASTW